MKFGSRTFLPGWRFAWLALGWLLAGSFAFACSVPVFRYALERWTPDVYNVVVFHRGEMGTTEQSLLQRIDTKGGGLGSLANAETHLADLDGDISVELQMLWEAQQAEKLPWMVVLRPRANPASGTVWSGPLAEQSVSLLVNSPVRQETAKRLLSGTTAVWVLLESGNPGKDEAAERRLQSRLAYLEGELKVGELDPQDIADGLVDAAPETLKVAFSMVRVSRKDPQEQLFVRMLLETEEDLKEFDEPIVFPIFGQGRVLYALIGAGINNETIDETAGFLVGPCSCQVKEQNPGMDLVFSVDWGGLVNPIVSKDLELPPLAGLEFDASVPVERDGLEPGYESGDSAGHVREPQVAEVEHSTQVSDGPIVRNVMILLLLTAVGGIGVGFFVTRGK